MKTVRKLARTSPRLALRPARPELRRAVPQREHVVLCDLTDCLLQAYEFVARRAYEKFLQRGSGPGRELEDWLSAERELLLPITVDIEESADYVRALASAPGFIGSQIGVGIEQRWLAIIASHDSPQQPPPAHRAQPAQHVQPTHPAHPVHLVQPAQSAPSAPLVHPAHLAQVFSIHRLPADVDPTRATIAFANGLLGIRIPKA